MNFFRKKTKKERILEARCKRVDSSSENNPLNPYSYWSLGLSLFLAEVFLVYLICFVGQSPAGPQVVPNQVARTRVVADFPFDYVSVIRTKKLQRERQQVVAPVFKIDEAPYNRFASGVKKLESGIAELSKRLNGLPEAAAVVEKHAFLGTLLENNVIRLEEQELESLLRLGESKRARLLDEGLSILKEIVREGIYTQPEESEDEIVAAPYFYNFDIDGQTNDSHVQSEKNALRLLRMNLYAMDIDYEITKVLFHLVKQGVSPNLVHDPVKTQEKIKQVLNATPPVVVSVHEGQTIIEPGSVVSAEQHEQLSFYRQKIKEHQLKFNFLGAQRLLFTIALIWIGGMHILLSESKTRRSKRCIVMVCIVLLINLSLMRMVMQLSETNLFGQNPLLLAILPYASPIFIGPIVITLMVDAAIGFLMAFLVSVFNALMLGNAIDSVIMGIIPAIVAVYFCQYMRLRSRVVRAGAIAGLALAFCGFLAAAINEPDIHRLFSTVWCQMLVAEIMGVLCGVIAVGLIPVLENIFRYTTDITLLELTDYNHPLLRRLQLVAPGTYHHSLMVANLAERAASDINANPLLCRACALFHDVGKIAKPEYFTENQSDGTNPHNEKNPSMSALVIKSHIKEGIEFAKMVGLPRVIVDVIQQHHGNSLIQYFYHKALQQSSLESGAEGQVDEATFRYEGPRPRFKESAVIFFADAVEAASRSLSKVTPQTVDDLIERIFQDRMNDHQLDECPVTFQEMEAIKKSFSCTLLNMFHTRISYPTKNDAPEQQMLLKVEG